MTDRPARVNPATAPYKSLLGIPWRVATALTDDRWVLRNDIIWHKPNGLPHSGTDRLANRHEHLFLFTPTPRGYHFDLAPLRTPPRRSAERSPTRASHPDGANPGDVWTISATPAQPGHTAGYPAELARRAITAGSPAGGVVLDFCSGTATTGVAALELGRRYIGIELHQPDNDAAARRLARASWRQ